jgi:DNA polymerase
VSTPSTLPNTAAPPRSPDLERLGAAATGEEIIALPDLVTLDAVAQRCTRCSLHGMRRSVVFGEGDPRARLVCVGEAPGAREDETGRPFVGRAGKLLDRLLLAVGFQRDEVFICNVLKCRPPQNRNPQPDEIEACSPFLLRQIKLIDPAVIIAFGSFAAQTLLQTRESIGRLRGRTHLYEGFPLVVTYHPAALLRNPRWTRKTWEDLQGARRLVDADGAVDADSAPDAAAQLALTPDG